MKSSFMSRAMIGLMLIAIGVLFMLDQMNLFEFDFGSLFSTYWPVMVIFVGLHGAFSSRRYTEGWGGGGVWNAFIVLLGVMFLLDNLDIFDFTFQMIWPVAIIFAGLSFLFGRSGGRRNWKEQPPKENGDSGYKPNQDAIPPNYDPTFTYGSSFDKQQAANATAENPGAANGETKHNGNPKSQSWGSHNHGKHKHYKQHWNWNMPQDSIQRSSFIGDVHLGVDYWELKPTQVSHFIGDTIIDLTKASIPYGETNIVISAFIGDVKVFVPNDAQVEVRVSTSAFIGDLNVLDRYEGGLFKSVQLETPFYADADKKIFINVSSFIGDVSVKKIG
ncbi:cell wall-active antibiotics response protein LiaF [Paenibacillus sp. MBLB4367]|uniref:cell wall-active antibiotics response protein LiaF n=1 Tax=Paenibacillus sp. MBLB4367 TaxID=3384767 RepID=UPI0039082F5F